MLPQLAVTLVLTLAAAELSYRLAERPVERRRAALRAMADAPLAA